MGRYAVVVPAADASAPSFVLPPLFDLRETVTVRIFAQSFCRASSDACDASRASSRTDLSDGPVRYDWKIDRTDVATAVASSTPSTEGSTSETQAVSDLAAPSACCGNAASATNVMA